MFLSATGRVLAAVPSVSELADPPTFYDKLSAWSTLGATMFAATAIGITILLAKNDRDRAKKELNAAQAKAVADAEAAEQRLREEREAADQRLREERAIVDSRQQREWQQQAARALLVRIAGLQPFLEHLTDFQPISSAVPDRQGRQDAVAALVAGAHTEALMLRDPAGTALYRNLVTLVVSLDPRLKAALTPARGDAEAKAKAVEMAVLNIRRYARFVRLWLHHLVETGAIPADAASEPLPVIGAIPPRMWTPIRLPEGWDADTATDPADPQFQPQH